MSATARRPRLERLDPRQSRASALGLAALIGTAAIYMRLMVYTTSSDMIWPHCAAGQWLQGNDPYGPACLMYDAAGTLQAVYPFTTMLAMLPFASLSWVAATALILGLTAGLLAYGLVRGGGPAMLVVFLSAPAIDVLKWGQWMYLIPAIALLPALYPLTALKPHVALPVVVTRLSWRRVLALAAFGLAALILLPGWPTRWLGLTTTYDGFVPILSASGLIFLPLLLLWRDPDARYLLLVALTPQRGFYDAMLAVPVLGAAGAALVWTFSTWALAGVARSLGADFAGFHNFVGYLPAIALVALHALRARGGARAAEATPPETVAAPPGAPLER